MGIPIKLKHSAADPVRLSFPELFKPVRFKNKPENTLRYDATVIVKPGGANDKIIQAAIQQAALEAADGKQAKATAFIEANKGNSNRYCYTLGDTKDYEGYAGNMILASHRNADQGRPGVFDCTRAGPDGKPVPLVLEDGKPYSGCYVNFSGEIYVQMSGDYPGVRCGLAGVFFAADGDHFSGARTADAGEFDVADGADAADDLA